MSLLDSRLHQPANCVYWRNGNNATEDDSMDLNDLVVYQRAMRVGETVWSMVDAWPPFARRTIGYQLVRSADSIAANISEGHGRYHYGENRQYCYYSRGFDSGNTNVVAQSAQPRASVPRRL